MIQDLDGVTTEPTRRGHVVALSAAVAAVSLGLLMALVVPRMDTPPFAASSAAGPTDGRLVIFGSDSPYVPSDRSGAMVYAAPLRDGETSTECAAGIGSNPPIHLLFDHSGQLIAAYTGGKTGRFIPLPQAYVGSGWFTVPCDTSDVFAPRLNRAR